MPLTYQLSVEICPPNVATTSGSIIIGSGRVGSMIAPLLFENLKLLTGHSNGFFITLGVLCAVAVFAAPLAPTPVPYKMAEARPAEGENSEGGEREPPEGSPCGTFERPVPA